ncbi:AMP-binding protein [Ruminococcus sp.]|uniref:AMP-binding protein n=1 Tax=Ruminococcus sp. TaxID=41978 RepID=UPI0025D499C1|nr:AMP-binding protein [Ruminococcus sp.]MBQ8965689.1 acyl--CoA ligase [Ruminococcus sp.]
MCDQKAYSFIKERNSQNLHKTALKDGLAEYSYSDMFKKWEEYAAVFSALGITGKNKARAGLLGSTSAEAIFAFYGLNMVGAEVSLLGTFYAFSHKKLMTSIQQEKLTDIILTDDFAQPALISELLMKKSALGLKNIILLHIPFGGSSVSFPMAAAQEYKYMAEKQLYAPICMDSLLQMYASHPVSYAENVSSDTAVIIHTSGTTSGMGKPINLSDSALNNAGLSYDMLESFRYLKEDLVCALTIDLSNSYGIVAQVHAPLSIGGAVAMTPAGSFNPMFYKAVPEFGISLLFCTAAILDMWIKHEEPSMDFSSVKCVVIGGAAVSAEDKHRCLDLLCRHGGKNILFINGYGLSELGGACILSTPDLDDDSIGYTMPGVEFCLYDEEEDKFHTMEDTPCRGVLYLHSPAMTTGILDGEEIVKTELIADKRYVCSNDLVSADADGKIHYLGRANRYFLNDAGKKYEAGRVEAEIKNQAGIESCGVIPFYVKVAHDNVPMLCVKTRTDDCTAPEVVRRALIQVFVLDKTLPPDQLPERIMLRDDLPRNQNGKVDLYKLGQEKLSGKQFKTEAVKVMGRLTDIALIPVVTEEDDMLQDVLKSIAKDITDNNCPFNNNSTTETEETTMKQNFDPFAFFNSSNRMNDQVKDMMSKMFSCMQGGQQGFPFMGGVPQMPQMPQMFGMPPFGQMPNFGQMPMMPMMPMQGSMPQFGCMPDMQQMNKMMSAYAEQMFNMTKQTMEMMYQQNMQMLEKMNEIVQNSLKGAESSGQDKPSEAESED